MTLLLLLNRNLVVIRAKLCLVSVFPDIVKDCPKIRNLPKKFSKKFRECGPSLQSGRLSYKQCNESMPV